MPEIKNLYIYINSTSLEISYTPIIINNIYRYVYIEITVNNSFTDIYNIKITYKNGLDILHIIDDKINLRSILSITGNTLLDVIKLHYVTCDDEYFNNVFYNSPYPGETSPSSLQKYINTFVGTMSLVYFSYMFIINIKNYNIYSNDTIIPKIKITDISKNLYIYMSYIYDYIDITDNDNNIIKLCLNEINLRWKYFNDIIINGPTYDYIKSNYIALHGYAKYIKSESLKFDELHNQLNSKYDKHMETVNFKNNTINNTINSMLLANLTITTNTLETLESKSNKLKDELYNIKANCSDELLEESISYKNEINKLIDSTLVDNIDHKINVLYEKYKNKLNDKYKKICDTMIDEISNKIYKSVEKKIDDYINDRIYSTNISNIVEEYLKNRVIE